MFVLQTLKKNAFFAAVLVKGMPCEPATVPAAVNLFDGLSNTSHCLVMPDGKAGRLG